MNKLFTYSILQYKHSNMVREAINVGILFVFYETNEAHFVFGNAQRVKAIYPNFDPSIFNATLRYIDRALKIESNSIFKNHYSRENIKQFISSKLLSEDASVLQFTDPINANSISDINKTIKDYTNILLPGANNKKPDLPRHNEAYILKEFRKYLLDSDINVIDKFHEKKVKANNVEVKFDLSWQNGTLNLVKPISFDLKEAQDIQNKAAQFFGYFTLLSEYAIKNNCKFDLVIGKPQDRKLFKEYDRAKKTLEEIKTSREIIEEDEIKGYTQNAINYLASKNSN